jgi:hypothetical protein
LKDDRAELAAEGYRDPIAFCKIFLPRLFPNDIPWVHRGIWALLAGRADFLERYGEIDKIISNFTVENEDRTKRSLFYWDDKGTLCVRTTRFMLVKLPRGFSKTTLVGTAASLRDILYQLLPFGAYVSEASDHAERQLTTIKYELETNRRIISVFGELKPSLSSGLKWNEGFFETTTGMSMIARGRGGQIRGLNHKGNRPLRIICDDIEDRESVKNDEQRAKTREWAFGELMPAIDEISGKATLFAIGTLLHPEALLQVWEADPQFTVVRFGAHDRQGDLLWPLAADEKKLAEKKASYVRAGLLHTFYMEYYNEYRVPEGMKFRPEYIRHEPPGDKTLVTAIYCDPAVSEKKKADDAVIAVVGMSERGEFYVLDIWGKQGATPREIIDQFFLFDRVYEPRRRGVEANAFQKALVHIMREEMFRKKQYFEIEPIVHGSRASTDERVELILQPRYAAGYVRHVRVFSKLETQLLDWNPPGHHNDYPDAVCGAIELLDPHASLALERGDKTPEDDEYDEPSFAVGAP